MCQGQFNGLPNLLLLHVHSTNISVCYVRLLILAQHRNGRVGLGRKDIDESIRMAMQSDRGGGLQLFTIERGQDTDDIIRAGRRLNNSGAVVPVSNPSPKVLYPSYTFDLSLP